MINEFFSCSYEFDDDFQMLTWWKNHELQFIVLTRIVTDMLVILTSTIALDSIFSAGRRVLDEKRPSLSPDFIKICVCKKNRDQAAKRQQWMKDEDEEFEDDLWMTMYVLLESNQSNTDFQIWSKQSEPNSVQPNPIKSMIKPEQP